MSTVCTACPYGQYSDQIEASSCKSWSDCGPGTHITSAGNSTTDRKCALCLPGKASSRQNQYYCYDWATCSSSQFESEAPSDSKDRICEDCPLGTYTLEHNGKICLSLFDHACHSDWNTLNLKMKRFCKDLFNVTRPRNTTVGNNSVEVPEMFDYHFFIFISITALIGSTLSILITVCILTHHQMHIPTLTNRRQRGSSEKAFNPAVLHVNKPWEHVLEDYLTKPSVKLSTKAKQKVSPTRREGAIAFPKSNRSNFHT